MKRDSRGDAHEAAIQRAHDAFSRYELRQRWLRGCNCGNIGCGNSGNICAGAYGFGNGFGGNGDGAYGFGNGFGGGDGEYDDGLAAASFNPCLSDSDAEEPKAEEPANVAAAPAEEAKAAEPPKKAAAAAEEPKAEEPAKEAAAPAEEAKSEEPAKEIAAVAAEPKPEEPCGWPRCAACAIRFSLLLPAKSAAVPAEEAKSDEPAKDPTEMSFDELFAMLD